VISLPQETFVSSGASVKASLLFLQKFNQQEKQLFKEIYERSRAEVIAKYSQESAKNGLESGKQKREKLKNDLKKQEDEKEHEIRLLLKDSFDYLIFMYDAKSVGITATGDDDTNELYPNNNQPKDIEKTCIELYQEFLKNRNLFAHEGGNP